MTRSSKSYFDYSFLLYYISYDYEFILVGKYIWLQIHSCQIFMTKKIDGKLLVKYYKVWISFCVCVLYMGMEYQINLFGLGLIG
jgi:hypothetical protein